MEFAFQTDDGSLNYCERVLVAMQLLYDVDPKNGCQLLNEHWRGRDWRGSSEESVWLFHETEKEWAQRIGNPRPYTGGADEQSWQEREDEAYRRIESFFKDGKYDWLWPPGWDVTFAYRKLYGDRPPGGTP
jgi:hypothetical protein